MTELASQNPDLFIRQQFVSKFEKFAISPENSIETSLDLLFQDFITGVNFLYADKSDVIKESLGLSDQKDINHEQDQLDLSSAHSLVLIANYINALKISSSNEQTNQFRLYLEQNMRNRLMWLQQNQLKVNNDSYISYILAQIKLFEIIDINLDDGYRYLFDNHLSNADYSNAFQKFEQSKYIVKTDKGFKLKSD